MYMGIGCWDSKPGAFKNAPWVLRRLSSRTSNLICFLTSNAILGACLSLKLRRDFKGQCVYSFVRPCVALHRPHTTCSMTLISTLYTPERCLQSSRTPRYDPLPCRIQCLATAPAPSPLPTPRLTCIMLRAMTSQPEYSIMKRRIMQLIGQWVSVR